MIREGVEEVSGCPNYELEPLSATSRATAVDILNVDL
jgi:hypothetical protein